MQMQIVWEALHICIPVHRSFLSMTWLGVSVTRSFTNAAFGRAPNPPNLLSWPTSYGMMICQARPQHHAQRTHGS
jgi:hypothetical protein